MPYVTPRFWRLLPVGAIAMAVGAVSMAVTQANNPSTATTAAASQPATTQANVHPKLTKEEEIARVMEFFKTTQPDVYAQAQVLKETDPKKFESLIHGALSKVNKLADLRTRNPRLFELNMQDVDLTYRSIRISKELRRTDLVPAERDRLTKELTGYVAQDFDVCQKIRQQEIEDMKSKISTLESKLADRAKDKDQLIQQRVTDLVENPPRTDW
jgi:hypothetical protein